MTKYLNKSQELGHGQLFIFIFIEVSHMETQPPVYALPPLPSLPDISNTTETCNIRI